MAKAKFLSTPSARRATHLAVSGMRWFKISIHALREEGDHKLLVHTASVFNFYPRPPRGGRQQRDNAADDVMRFLSTPSARRATCKALGIGANVY